MAVPRTLTTAAAKIEIDPGPWPAPDANHGRTSETAVNPKRILVIDVGGSNVKLMISSRAKRRKFASGSALTPARFIAQTRALVGDWKFDAIAIGFPAPVKNGRIAVEPKNLGKGWKRANFRRAFKKPVRLMNDAAMQALGTGLGSPLLWDRTVLSLELGDLPYIEGESVEAILSDSGLDRLGERRWRAEVLRIVPALQKAFIADYVVLGGGNAKRIDKLPPHVELGHNRNAYAGGVRLWQAEPRMRRPKWNII
jgi:hypothetical protein